MKKIKFKIIIGILVIFLGGYFLYKILPTQDIPKINIVKVKKGYITTSITAVGRIKAVKEVEIISKTQALVDKVLVEEGANVKKGTCLAKFDENEARNLYNQAKERLNETYIELNDSKTQLNIENELYNVGAISQTHRQKSQDRYNLAKIRVKMAQEELALTEIRLNNLRCTAPIAGLIITKNIKDNQFVPIGYLLFTIADISSLEIEADVDELDAVEVKRGNKAIITSEIIKDKEILGIVKEIAPKATLANRGEHTIIKVTITPETLPPTLKVGNQVEVKIITQSKNTTYLPVEAVLEDNEGKFVYLYRQERAEKKRITTGISNISHIEVFGLNSADEIIKPQGIELKDKMKVIKIK